MADPYIEEWHSRDLDATVIQREVDAVQEWKKTSLGFHIMRDNPMHCTAILAGMFGARQDTPERKKIRQEEFTQMIAEFSSQWSKGMDQTALTYVVAPNVVKDSLVHDSYLCGIDYLGGSKPVAFPSKRIDPVVMTETSMPNFVGNTGTDQIDQECPLQCRPVDHQDWKFC